MKSAAATVAEIEELIKEILVRVPTKSLLKFKCVSKQWLSLISDPHFCASHVRCHQSFNPTTIALFLDNSINDASQFQVIPLNSCPFTSEKFVVKYYLNVPGAKILQSCNGLLLLCRSSCSVDVTEQFYFICNPTTRQFKKLRLPSSLNTELRIHGAERCTVCLVFDPRISSHYKVIFISNLSDVQDSVTYWVEVYIYFSELDTWTSQRICVDFEFFLDSSFLPLLGTYFLKQVYCNGSMHWLRSVEAFSLLCFDVDTMIFKKMNFTEDLDVRYFGDSQGHLYCITYKHGYHEMEYDVVEIAADYSGWCVRYHVNLQSIKKAYRCRDISLLSLICDENAEEWTLVIFVDKSPMAYDLSDGTLRRLYHSKSKLPNSFYKVYPYVESLVCV